MCFYDYIYLLIHITILNIYSLIVTLPVLLAAARCAHGPVTRLLFGPETCRVDIKVVRLTFLTKRAILGSENFGVLLREFCQNFLSVLHLHQGWLKAFDCVQNLFFQKFILNNSECLLQHIVAKLVVYQTLNDKVDSWLQSLGVAQSLHQLAIVLIKGPLEYFVDMVVSAVQAFLDHIRREFQLTQSDEVFSDLFEDLLIFRLVSKL